MTRVVLFSAGPGLPDVVKEYGHSSEWIPDLIKNKNIEIVVRKAYEGDLGDINEADAWIISGSKYSVYDDCKWIENLIDYVSKLINANKSVLGICFGHQLVAKCLGAEVKKNPLGWELGSYQISLSDKGIDHPLFSGINEGDIVYESHQDVVCNMTQGMTSLAFTDKANQSFSFRENIFGVQFHPEFSWDVTKKLMDLRIKNGVKVDSSELELSVNSHKILDNFISIVKEN